eukprot:jgi/Ulvmu1/6686/UM030_0017.1
MILKRFVYSYVDVCIKWPVLVLSIQSCVFLILAIITVLTGQMATLNYGGSEWLVKSDPATKRWYASERIAELASEYWGAAGGGASSPAQPVRSQPGYNIVFIYNTEEPNLFTPEILESIRQVENILLSDPRYTEFCQLQSRTLNASANAPCQPSLSVLSLFHANTTPGVGFPDTPLTEARIETVLRTMSRNLYSYGSFFDSGFTSMSLKSQWTRSIYPLGLPLPGFTAADTRTAAQEEVIGEWLADVDAAILEAIDQQAGFLSTPLSRAGRLPGVSAAVDVIYMHEALSDREFQAVVNTDLLWSVMSFASVFAYTVFHTRSFLMASVGMFASTIAYPAALLVYRVVFRVQYYDSLNTLVLFILLGIGADGLFVYFDAFRQSDMTAEACATLRTRMLYTVERAAAATLVTSFTTAASFLATYVSRMIPVAAFGLFAFTCMVMLYTATTLLIPPALVVWHNHFSLLPFATCSKRCPCVDRTKVDMMLVERSKQSERRRQLGRSNTMVEALSTLNIDADVDDLAQFTASERFFGTRFFDVLRMLRWPLVAAFLIALGFGANLAFQITPPVNVEELFPRAHVITRFTRAMDSKAGPFQASRDDVTVPVDLVIGLEPPFLDDSGRSKWDAAIAGRPIVDGTLDGIVMSRQGRQWLMSVCEVLKEEPCGATACDPVFSGADFPRLVRREGDDPKADCWTDALTAWMAATGRGTFASVDDGAAVPTLVEFFANHPALRGDMLFAAGADGTPRPVATRLHFESTFVAPQSQADTQEVVDEWDAAVARLERAAPRDAGVHLYSTGRYPWAWLVSQQELVRSALSGMGLSFAMAFLVLNLATGNIVMAILSTLTVAGVMSMSLGIGIVGIMGWPLGISESISVVILIGFSMDYVLHIADAYMDAEGTRVERTQHALLTLGVSVLAGSNTTNVAGIWLWFGTMVFFNKFAFLINMTVCSALLWSLVFLPSALMIVGPYGSIGSWKAGWMWLRKRKGSSVEPQAVEISDSSS